MKRYRNDAADAEAIVVVAAQRPELRFVPLQQARAVLFRALEGSWIDRLSARKPKILVAIALANKMARMIWAMLTKQEDYKDPVPAGAVSLR